MQFQNLYRGGASIARNHNGPIRWLRTTTMINAPADTEFVRRRRVYRDELRQQRNQFQRETEEQEKAEVERLEREAISGTGVREEREARRREKSLAKQQGRLALLAEIRERKEKRKAYKRCVWEQKQKDLEDKKFERLDMLLKASDCWITEENMAENVEDVVDAFFIATDLKRGGQEVLDSKN